MFKEILYDSKAELYGQYINEWLLSFVPPESKVLDVGCSAGLFGERLILQKQCIVHGVDISKVAIGKAKDRLHEAAYMDIENDELPFHGQRYDLIVFADVLEHLVSPEAAIEKFIKLLRDDGSFLISLPNIANIRFRVRHLLGSWDYCDGGILDRTHLHFYTQKTAKKLVNEHGLKVISLGATPGFDFIIGRFAPFKAVTDQVCMAFPRIFANQFIIVAKPAP